jgi:hypothetical protein
MDDTRCGESFAQARGRGGMPSGIQVLLRLRASRATGQCHGVLSFQRHEHGLQKGGTWKHAAQNFS